MSKPPITIKTSDDLHGMRAAGKACAQLLDHLSSMIVEGVSTQSIDDAARDFIRDKGWIAAPLNYAPPGHKPFPAHLCASINHQVCHGVPGPKKLVRGDLVKIDCTVIVDGWHGDSCRSYVCGPQPKARGIAAARLSDLTRQAMWEGIFAAKPGAPLSNVGAAIERFAKRNGLGIVRSFTGHGIGRAFHEAPSVKNFFDPHDTTILVPGMCITVEPMLCLGHGNINILADGWTVVTSDKTLCAQWEHTLAITENGPEVLTLSEMNPSPA